METEGEHIQFHLTALLLEELYVGHLREVEMKALVHSFVLWLEPTNQRA